MNQWGFSEQRPPHVNLPSGNWEWKWGRWVYQSGQVRLCYGDNHLHHNCGLEEYICYFFFMLYPYSRLAAWLCLCGHLGIQDNQCTQFEPKRNGKLEGFTLAIEFSNSEVTYINLLRTYWPKLVSWSHSTSGEGRYVSLLCAWKRARNNWQTAVMTTMLVFRDVNGLSKAVVLKVWCLGEQQQQYQGT